jgi:hypothetical protein
MRGVSVIFSIISFAVAGGLYWYFMRDGMDKARELQQQIQEKVGGAKAGQRNIKNLPKEAQPIALGLNKNNHYVECYNGFEKSRKHAVKRYFSWVKDPKQGPTGKERHVYGIHKILQFDRCRNGVNEASKISVEMKELNELGKLMETYLGAGEKMVALVEKMHRYYEDEDYKDDKFAKGNKLHQEFMKHLSEINPLAQRFQQLLMHVEDKLGKQRMEYYQKNYGEKVRYLLMKTQVEAKRFVEIVQKEKDAEKVRKTLDDLIDTHKTLADYIDKNEKEVKDSVGQGSTLKRFVSGSWELITKGKIYSRALSKAAKNPKNIDKFLRNAFGGRIRGKGSEVLRIYNDRIANLRLSIPW